MRLSCIVVACLVAAPALGLQEAPLAAPRRVVAAPPEPLVSGLDHEPIMMSHVALESARIRAAVDSGTMTKDEAIVAADALQGWVDRRRREFAKQPPRIARRTAVSK